MQARGFRGALLGLALAAGATQIAAGATMYGAGVYFRAWSMIVSVAILVGWIAGAMVRLRGPGLTYARALAVGVAVSVATGVLYALYTVILARVDPKFLEELVRLWTDLARQRGEPPAAIADIAARATAAGVALGNLVRLSLFGSVVSLVLARVLRTRR